MPNLHPAKLPSAALFCALALSLAAGCVSEKQQKKIHPNTTATFRDLFNADRAMGWVLV